MAAKTLEPQKIIGNGLKRLQKDELKMTMGMLIMTMPNQMAWPYDNFDCLLYIIYIIQNQYYGRALTRLMLLSS